MGESDLERFRKGDNRFRVICWGIIVALLVFGCLVVTNVVYIPSPLEGTERTQYYSAQGSTSSEAVANLRAQFSGSDCRVTGSPRQVGWKIANQRWVAQGECTYRVWMDPRNPKNEK